MLVQLRVTGLAPVTFISIDLLGDGLPGFDYSFAGTPEDDGRNERAFARVPRRAGSWDLSISAVDAWGCTTQTGVRRAVTVLP